jgi:hypothetical protein
LQSSVGGEHNSIARRAIEEVLISLGPSIEKTIMWHMNNRGVFANPQSLDILTIYTNLQELMGPYAEEIVEMTWERLESKYGAFSQKPSSKPIEKIKEWLTEEEK